jgi:hypothetical protein
MAKLEFENLAPEAVDSYLDWFFRQPPANGPGLGNMRSILYLLRRDLRDVSAHEGRKTANKRLKAPVLGAFGIMVGYEILAQVWTGKSSVAKKQLRQTYREVLGVSPGKANLMIQFRNALAHGYTLEITDRADGKKYGFILSNRSRQSAWFRKEGGKFRINFWALRWRFLQDLKRLHQRLLDRSLTARRRAFISSLNSLGPYIVTFR